MKQLLDIAIRLGAFGLFAVAVLGITFTSGALFGLLGKGAGLDGLLSWLKEWQELVGAILGALVTGAAAFMITMQIKADDDRESKKQRSEAVSVALLLRIEANRILDAYAERIVRAQKIRELTGNDFEHIGRGLMPSNKNHTEAVRHHLTMGYRAKVTRNRLTRFENQIGALGPFAANFFIDFYELFQTDGSVSEFNQYSLRFYAEESTQLGATGAALVYVLTQIAVAKGDQKFVEGNAHTYGIIPGDRMFQERVEAKRLQIEYDGEEPAI